MPQEPHLEIRTLEGSRQLPLGEKPVTIGRNKDNLIVLADGMSSRYHCVIEQVDGAYRVRDLNSSNGTKVNGQVVKSALLINGDVITVGKTQIHLTLPDPTLAGLEELAEDAVVHEELEELSEDDVVEMGGEKQLNLQDLVEALAESGDYGRVLRDLAAALPDRTFSESDIALINARGQVVHAAGVPEEGAGRKEIVEALRSLLLVCFRSRASDIHLEPKNDGYHLRVRIDGVMVELLRMSIEMGVRLSALVKVLSDIDIAQKNNIQEGHFTSRVPGRRVDYRVSFAPTVFGQKLVMRILDTANAPLRLKDLELPEWMERELADAIEQESGMVLISGPTGSGKTTSLYSMIRTINVNERNVVTIEDPVEIQIEGVTQIPVNDEQGKTFSNLLRSVLRQDPDAILIGEIRDAETARIAMQASTTGHLVFSTVHTKDTIGTIYRLLDLGVEPYLVGQGLHTVLAQRLVRRLCPYCKKKVRITEDQKAQMGPVGENVTHVYEPAGCARCLGTGFAGRRAFFELLRVTEELRGSISRNLSMADIQKSLGKNFLKLSQAGYALVADGTASYDEIEKAVGREARAAL